MIKVGAMVTEGLGALVRRRRIELGLRQEDLAERLGKDQSYVSSLERGRFRVPGRDVFDDLAAALNVPVIELAEAAGTAVAQSVFGEPVRESVDPDEVDLNNPLVQFYTSHARDFSAEEERTLIELMRVMLRGKQRPGSSE